MSIKAHIIPPLNENVANPQGTMFQKGLISTPTPLSFNKIDGNFHAQGAVGILYIIENLSNIEQDIFKISYILEPEIIHKDFVVDNTYKEFGYARARCEYLNASALWKHTLKHLSEARKMLEEYNLLTDQST